MISPPCNAAPPRPKIGTAARPSGAKVDAPVFELLTRNCCVTPLDVGNALSGTELDVVYAVIEILLSHWLGSFASLFGYARFLLPIYRSMDKWGGGNCRF